MPITPALGVNRNLQDPNEEYWEIYNAGWHNQLAAQRPPNYSIDPKGQIITPVPGNVIWKDNELSEPSLVLPEANSPPDPHDDALEIQRGKHSRLGGRTDFYPDPQNISDVREMPTGAKTTFSFEEASQPMPPKSTFSFEEAQQPAQARPESTQHGFHPVEWVGKEAAGVAVGAGESFGDMMLGGQELVGHALNLFGFDGAGQYLIDDARTGAKKLAAEAKPYRKEAPSGTFVGDVLGAVAVPELAAGRLGLAARPITKAITEGGISGALQPTTGDNFPKEKAAQIALGGAAGAGSGALGKGLSAMVAPKLGPDAAALAARGVQMTPGQMAGGAAKRGEESLASVPLVGSLIRHAEHDSIESFNRAVIDDALQPIGQKLPKTVTIGRPAVQMAADKISDAYNNLLPLMQFRPDRQFVADISNLATLARFMPQDQSKQFARILNDRVALRLGATGIMSGETLKQLEGELGHFASTYRSSSDAAQRQLGDAVREMQELLRDTLVRQNPAQATELKAINTAFAKLVRVEGAASNRVTTGGVFTPGDLLQSIRRTDRSVRKRQFAQGDALMQEFAESGQKVLGSRVRDSGTPERALWAGLVAGTYLENPNIALGLGAASLPYTKPALAAANRIAQPAGPTRQTISDGLRQLGIVVAPGVAEDVNRPRAP